MARTPNFKRNRTLADLISDTRKPKREADTAWYRVGIDQDYEVPFENSWDNVGGVGIPPAQWYMDEFGEVKCKGLVDGGAEGTTIFTLPEENRPQHKEVFTCALDGGGTANVAVYPNGEVVLESFN
jgi:hypothetical protein